MRIVARVFSGLGNQLFQYAAGYYYARRFGASLSLSVEHNATSYGYPRPFMLSHFGITAPCHQLSRYERLLLTRRKRLKPLAAMLRGVQGIQVTEETVPQRHRFMPALPAAWSTRTMYLIGYWQAWQFAQENAEELRREFRLREAPRGRNLEFLGKIRLAVSPVSLHVRRGDFTLAAEGNIALPVEYYRRAIRFFQDRLPDPTFFVFSDDMEYARQSLPRDARLVFVDCNDEFSAHEDLRLMSSCCHHILANSSFSWWGAWLNPRTDKTVVAPRRWDPKLDSVPDLLPLDWILMENRSDARHVAEVGLQRHG